ncbi:MAG: DUF1073 domain-containing protein [Leptospira sp.]|nr:DUF1073 domain-containing protein [Leptospira sp.]
MNRDRKIRRRIGSRIDSFLHAASGKGMLSRDKLEGIAPNPLRIPSSDARQWYLSNGFIQNIIDIPAEDATREWIELKTNMDDDNPDTGQTGLNISRLILNRMTELKLRSKIKELIRYSRLYNEGGCLFWGVKCDLPQFDKVLSEPMVGIRKLDYINLLTPENFTIYHKTFDPLSRNFNRPDFLVRGNSIHQSRVSWLCHSYIHEERRGVSVLETILEGIKAQDTALWSITNILFELSAKVFKSEKVNSSDPAMVAGFMHAMRMAMSTQGSVALDKDEELTRIANSGISDANIEAMGNYIWETLAGLSRMPKSRLQGQSQGVITAGQYDLIGYYDTIAKFNEIEVRPIIEKAIEIIVNETEGEIFRLLGSKISSLDWEFSFKSLWKIGPSEQAAIKLQNAQADQIYITAGVDSPSDVKRHRDGELQEFSEWEGEKFSFLMPAIPDPLKNPDPEKKNLEPSKIQNAKFGTGSPSGATGGT